MSRPAHSQSWLPSSVGTSIVKVHILLVAFALGWIVSCNSHRLLTKLNSNEVWHHPRNKHHALFDPSTVNTNGLQPGDRIDILGRCKDSSTWFVACSDVLYLSKDPLVVLIDPRDSPTLCNCRNARFRRTHNTSPSEYKVAENGAATEERYP